MVDAIASEIDSIGKDCAIIGICGKWGTGKSSVMNLLLDKLPSEKYQTIRFNPWMVRDDVDIIRRFFSTLESSLSKGSECKRKIKKAVKEVLKGAAEKHGGWPAVLVKAYYETVSSNDEVTEMFHIKKAINRSLSNSQKKYVVAIDDIDRMDKHEIVQIFKFIRNVTDFDNMIYLLAYDDGVVSGALATDAYDGHEYLQKIVDMPIYLPDASSKNIESILREDFGQITGIRPSAEDVKNEDPHIKMSQFRVPGGSAEDIKNEDPHIFDEMAHLFPNIITTIREEKRVINQFKTKYVLAKDDTSCYDLLALCILEMKRPSLIDWIKENSYLLCRDLSSPEQSSDREKLYESFKELDIDNSLRDLLQYMFPPSNKEPVLEAVMIANAGLNKRICHSEFFDNYFLQIPANMHMPESEMEHILSLTSPEEIEQILCRYEPESDLLFEKLSTCYILKKSADLPTVVRYLLCDNELVSRPRSFSPLIHAEIRSIVDNYCLKNSLNKTDFYIGRLSKVSIDSMFRFFVILENSGMFKKEFRSKDEIDKLVEAVETKIEAEYSSYPNPLSDPDYYSMVSYLYQKLGEVDLSRKIHNHFISTEPDVDAFLDVIGKLHDGFDGDLVVHLVDPVLMERAHYKEKYDERY
ncbi:KAP family P-loop NTPase fold protein [Methanomethylophilus alvi]|uniref:KAP family P-loop NTPase fold protein n=1 Tax=Methanomethylophilus alvi TaxID=1291540 RepID=UPI0013E0709A|nr:P-loop NTPase fold protein [Methanomethylophilus alvi]